MALTKQTKTNIIKDISGNEKNTGATDVQIALLSEQIKELREHIAKNKKDNRAIKRIVQKTARQKKLLKYLKQTDLTKYNQIITKLNLKIK